MSEHRPPCQFDDCDDEEASAVAVVAMFDPSMSEPYAWVMACAACATVALKGNGGSPLFLVAGMSIEHAWAPDDDTRPLVPCHEQLARQRAQNYGGEVYVREVTDWRPETTQEQS